MIHKKFVCAIFALVIGLFVSGCSQDEQVEMVVEDTSAMSSEQVLKEVMPVLQGFLNAQYDYVTDKNLNPKWNEYLLTGGDTLTAHLEEHKRLMQLLDGSKYVSYTSQVTGHESTRVSQSGEEWLLENVSDYYSIAYKSSLTTEGRLPYTFLVKKIDGKWRIIEWTDHHIVYDGGRWTTAKEDWPEELFISEGRKVTTRAATFPPVPAKPNLKRLGVKNYALTHWNNPNSKYVNFASMGGDCTNFVSQCLYEGGGWSMDNSWYYYSSSNRSTSWAGASNLQSYLAKSSRVNSSSEVYEIGDIIQKLSGSSACHSMVITSTQDGYPCVTYRSTTGGEDKNVKITNLSGKKCWKLKLWNLA